MGYLSTPGHGSTSAWMGTKTPKPNVAKGNSRTSYYNSALSHEIDGTPIGGVSNKSPRYIIPLGTLRNEVEFRPQKTYIQTENNSGHELSLHQEVEKKNNIKNTKSSCKATHWACNKDSPSGAISSGGRSNPLTTEANNQLRFWLHIAHFPLFLSIVRLI